MVCLCSCVDGYVLVIITTCDYDYEKILFILLWVQEQGGIKRGRKEGREGKREREGRGGRQ